MNEQTRYAFGSELKAAIKKQGLSIWILEKQLHIGRSQMEFALEGNPKVKVHTLVKLANVLGLKIEFSFTMLDEIPDVGPEVEKDE